MPQAWRASAGPLWTLQKEGFFQDQNGTGVFHPTCAKTHIVVRAADMLTGLKASLKTAAAAKNVARITPSPDAAPVRPKSPPAFPPSPTFVSSASLPTDLVSPAALRDGGRYHGVGTTFPRTADDGKLVLNVPVLQEEKDAYAVARRFFDAKEFERVAFTLGNYKSAQSRFLSYYSQYLVCCPFLSSGQLTRLG